jgi:hypothetical protein
MSQGFSYIVLLAIFHRCVSLPIRYRIESYISIPEDENAIGPRFAKAMEKLSLVGQDKNSLVDCSHMVPDVLGIAVPKPHLPAGKTLDDIEASVSYFSPTFGYKRTDNTMTLESALIRPSPQSVLTLVIPISLVSNSS